MIIKAKTIQGYKLKGIDGEVGKVKEFFFDDTYWTIRYLVADTGRWLSTRKVLISPYFLQKIDYVSELVNVDLTKSQIENSPPLENDKPVSRQYEESYYEYYESPVYWRGSNMWGSSSFIERDREKWESDIVMDENTWETSLRSTMDVSGYNIQASDDEIGHVDDFFIDDETWAIRYLIIDTKRWLPGKKVLISPQWIDKISWMESKVFVNMLRDTIKNAPEYMEEEVLNREYESNLYRYYGRQGYWMDEPATREYHR